MKVSRNSKITSSYKCDKCRDTGWILVPQERYNDLAIKCECQKPEAIRNNIERSGLKDKMSEYTFSGYMPWNEASIFAKKVAIKYFKDFKNYKNTRENSILLCGQVGSGKTHLATAIALNFLEDNKKVIYMSYRDEITYIKQIILDRNAYIKAIDKFKKCEILFIDDLFKGKVNESDINIMFEIVNYRYLNYLPMIISSEWMLENLLEFDEATASRIFEMCRKFIVQIPNNNDYNYRLRDR